MTYKTGNAEETKLIAANFAAILKGGEFVALQGELGSGKTTFVQGVCEALGVTEHVTSPTFAIMNVYKTDRLKVLGHQTALGTEGIRIIHLDLYRLKTVKEIIALGLEEYIGQPDTIVLVEWPDAVSDVQWSPTSIVQFTSVSETKRIIHIEYGDRGSRTSTNT